MLNFCHQKKTLIINYNHIIFMSGEKNQKNKDDDENEEEKENWN